MASETLALFWGKKLGIVNRFSIALFVPKYEIAFYDGGPKVVFSEKPYIIFYYPNAKIAFQKWDELAAIFAAEGALRNCGLHQGGAARARGI